VVHQRHHRSKRHHNMPCNVYRTVQHVGVSQKKIQSVVMATVHHLGSSKKDVSVHCVGEKKMRTMNRLFRGIDRPTDVLSFPSESMVPGYEIDDSGDIFLCSQYIERQAKRFDVPYKEEYYRMLIHGVLHLNGYDHEKPIHAKRMFSLQEDILAKVLNR